MVARAHPINYFIYEAPFGSLEIGYCLDSLVYVNFINLKTTPLKSNTVQTGALIEKSIYDVLNQYFEDPTQPLNVPLPPPKTLFQSRFRQAMAAIPAGQTITYSELADRLQTSPRAVASACRSNPIPLFIPCHRVIAQNGWGGYCGELKGPSLDVKRWLLKHEAKANGQS